MKILPASEGIDEAIKILQDGGVVIHATETCYGIACDLTNPAAVGRLFAAKARPPEQPVSALFPSMDAAGLFVECSPRALELAKKYLPGPLTLVLPRTGTAPIFVTVSGAGHDPMIGVRISSHPVAMELSRRFGRPIATTSANLHGLANPYSVGDIHSQFTGVTPEPDLVLDSGVLDPAPPSTVLQVLGDSTKVLRQGDLKI